MHFSKNYASNSIRLRKWPITFISPCIPLAFSFASYKQNGYHYMTVAPSLSHPSDTIMKRDTMKSMLMTQSCFSRCFHLLFATTSWSDSMFCAFLEESKRKITYHITYNLCWGLPKALHLLKKVNMSGIIWTSLTILDTWTWMARPVRC